MPENVQVKFEAGMDRRNDAPVPTPFELRNARVETHGGVRAHQEPETMVDPENAGAGDAARPEGAQPWQRWNDGWLSRFDSNGNEVMKTREEYNGNLFVSNVKSQQKTINGRTEMAPQYQYLHSDDSSFSELKGPAAIESVDMVKTFWQSSETGDRVAYTDKDWDILSISGNPRDFKDRKGSKRKAGIKLPNAASYLLIPINERQEAGPWAYFSTQINVGDTGFDNAGDGTYAVPGIKVKTNAATSHVEVYRTREFPSGAKGPPPDMSYYRIGKVAASGADAQQIFSGSDPKTLRFADFWYLPATPREDLETTIPLPSETLDRNINAWAHESLTLSESVFGESTYKHEFGPPKMVGAETLFMDGRDRMIAGSVQWPTKPAQFALALRTGTSLVGSLYYTNEYQPTNNQTIHGPVTEVPDSLRIIPVWQGEQAIHMYNDTNGPIEQLKRQTVQSGGIYNIFEVTREESGGSPNLTFPLSDVNQKSFIYEPNVALLSEQFRPLELTMEQQFTVPGGQEIKSIEPARLAEEESVATYSFYVLTDENVYVGNRQDEQTQLRLVNRVGVQSYRVDFTGGAPRPEYQYPLVAPTKYGTAYIGTDDRVYVLNGRQFETIDDMVPNIWWSDFGETTLANEDFQAIYNEYSDVWAEQTERGSVEFETLTAYDIAYNEDQDELYVVTNNNIWIYDFDGKGWVGNYYRPGVVSAQRLGYHKSVMLHRYQDTDNDGTVEDIYELVNEDGDRIEDTAVVTNPLLRSPGETKIRELEADYDPLFRENTVNWATEGATQVNLQDSNADDLRTKDEYSTVFIPEGKGSSDFTGLIENVVDSTTADLTDGLGPVPASDLVMRWYLPARVRQEATGDYYSAFTAGGDPIRRTEKSYVLRPRRRKMPRVNGSGHVIRFERFRSFKSMRLTVERFQNA